ncbi:hypothetical protein FJ872_11910 [Mesorhizobium sp. B2-5-9]|uniref:DUF6894 family protein n=1 Tax=Mesorhizobium sp. B2-5-9 TaxID=2589921 RepID=UPI00112B905E|nr:hypothetical protein [Mesorhizobium sp. B2-5-9]TPK20062.1 hypothetical protein FJ872_11910 [Mesorhizobium sp. B2-5-9]
MARYFFDTIENGQIVRDDIGADLSLSEMREEARRVLPSIAADQMLSTDLNEFVVQVRDEAGRCVYEASLTLISKAPLSPV